MPATITPPEQRIVLGNVSWGTYERLLAEREESGGARFTYDEGMLEIVVVSLAHENPNSLLSTIVDIVSRETRTEIWEAGGITCKRADLQKGFEPDASYYIKRQAMVRGKSELDFSADPAPDLVIEVDITRSSLNRFAIFAALGVLEVWRYDGERVSLHTLDGGRYIEVPLSVQLPPLTAAQATVFLHERRRMMKFDWMDHVAAWVQANRETV